MSNIDEIVVGQSNQDFLAKLGEEMKKTKEEEMEEDNKPLEERVKSKNWKARKNDYTEIYETLKGPSQEQIKFF